MCRCWLIVGWVKTVATLFDCHWIPSSNQLALLMMQTFYKVEEMEICQQLFVSCLCIMDDSQRNSGGWMLSRSGKSSGTLEFYKRPRKWIHSFFTSALYCWMYAGSIDHSYGEMVPVDQKWIGSWRSRFEFQSSSKSPIHDFVIFTWEITVVEAPHIE